MQFKVLKTVLEHVPYHHNAHAHRRLNTWALEDLPATSRGCFAHLKWPMGKNHHACILAKARTLGFIRSNALWLLLHLAMQINLIAVPGGW